MEFSFKERFTSNRREQFIKLLEFISKDQGGLELTPTEWLGCLIDQGYIEESDSPRIEKLLLKCYEDDASGCRWNSLIKEEPFSFDKKLTAKRKERFVEMLMDMQRQIGSRRVSSRGWCYLMENMNLINKGQFDKVQNAINDCRKQGLLPVDFVAEEAARQFENVLIPSVREGKTIKDTLTWMLSDVLDGHTYFKPEYWEGEEYYIQMIVEKVDLFNLFQPICNRYNIPIANSRGWSSILQVAEYAKRFKEAEEMDLKCVLLYCGDYDPDGIRISDNLRSLLEDKENVVWKDGTGGYNPDDLIIDRFGLQLETIKELRLTWIDNLMTGSKGYLAKEVNGQIIQGRTKQGKPHPNFTLDYVQEYLSLNGVRKCEANAIIPYPREAGKICTDAIEKYLGPDALDRFEAKREQVKEDYEKLLEEKGLRPIINDLLKDDE